MPQEAQGGPPKATSTQPSSMSSPRGESTSGAERSQPPSRSADRTRTRTPNTGASISIQCWRSSSRRGPAKKWMMMNTRWPCWRAARAAASHPKREYWGASNGEVVRRSCRLLQSSPSRGEGSKSRGASEASCRCSPTPGSRGSQPSSPPMYKGPALIASGGSGAAVAHESPPTVAQSRAVATSDRPTHAILMLMRISTECADPMGSRMYKG